MVQRQLDEHHNAIHGITERLDILTDVIKTMVENQQVVSPGEDFLDSRVSMNEERVSVPRGVRLDFSHFDGNNPYAWIIKANQYFDYHQTPLSQKLLMSSYHMEGKALIWYQDAIDCGVFNGWDSFVTALQVRFGPTAHDDPMEALTHLKQSSFVAVYKAQFEALCNKLKGLSKRHKLSCFLSGLKDEI